MHSAKIFEAVIKQATIGILVVNANGEIIYTNLFLQHLFGYDQDEINGKKIEILIPPRFNHKHVSHREKNVRNARPMGIGMDLFGLRKDGSEFPVEISLSHFNSQNEEYVTAFISDITMRQNQESVLQKFHGELETAVENRTKELKRTLEVLELLNEKLETSLSRQKAILDNAGVMLYVTNSDGLIKFFNSEAEKLTGYSAEEVVNRLTPIIFHDSKEIQICKEELEKEHGLSIEGDFEVLRIKIERQEVKDLECVYRKKNGELVNISLSISTIYDKNSKNLGYLGVAIDMSHRKLAQDNLLEALSKEKKIGELKSRFVAMASHEFRTPLSTILSSTYLVEKYTTTDQQENREKHLHRIMTSVNSLTNILNDFLSVGKIEENKIGIHYSDFKINKTIELIISDINELLKKGQQIRYHHTGAEVINLDASILNHILMNLISNAIKFSPEGAYIDIKTVVDHDDIKIEVIDNGIGISKEDQEHLTERFFRGNNAINIKGTGLGLHIVSKYVERMNGTIVYKSELNEGTTVTIIFKKSKPGHHEKIAIN